MSQPSKGATVVVLCNVRFSLVDAGYDTGHVVRQERIRVLPEDTIESLRARGQACEREVVVKTLAAIASGELILGTAG